MGHKTPPCPKYPTWTEARYNQFVRSALRAAFRRWPPKFDVLKNNRRVVTGKRHKYEYQCAECGEWFKQKEVQVDHIIPAGTSLKGWDEFIDKLFVGEDSMQILCKPCHKIKTKKERYG